MSKFNTDIIKSLTQGMSIEEIMRLEIEKVENVHTLEGFKDVCAFIIIREKWA